MRHLTSSDALIFKVWTFFGGERIGFIKFKAEVSNDNGEKFPGSVFLRGGSVAMLVSCTG